MSNKSNKQVATTSGISTLGLLGIAFVVLKLCHVINWSWWLVTLPFWGGLALFLVIALVIFLITALLSLKS